jgi:hypothetical protein
MSAVKNHLPRIVPLFQLLISWLLLTSWPVTSNAIPAFARQYDFSCSVCHVAFPRLNEFGKEFVASNMRLPNWKDKTVPAGDELLALPPFPPLAVRAQAFVQARQAEEIDPISGETITAADSDFQSPYLIKLLSSAPLSDHITYYFYAIFAEKGENGTTVVEDAWFRHDDIFRSGIGMQLGQFQLSDLMFARETRLTFQDFIPYRMAGITYERGVLFDRAVGPVDLAVGIVNGNGINAEANINSPGYQRPDKIFDNDNSKTVFGHIGSDIGPVSVGLLGVSGKQKNATGPAGTESGNRDTDKRVLGLDLSGNAQGNLYWYAQLLWNSWNGFLEPGKDLRWFGGFAGVDYVFSDRWVFSTLYNYADAGDLDNTDTIYEGINLNSLTFTSSYYFMRNVKGIVEVNVDFLGKQDPSGDYFVGHLTKENYLLVGFDAAF